MARRQITKHFWVDEELRRGAARLIAPLQLLTRPAPGEPAPDSGQTRTAQASQFYHDGTVNVSGAADAISPLSPDQILPRESDLYFLTMRAISQKVLEGHWVDYTRPGVLEQSAPLLTGKRICKDHQFDEVEDSIGAITQSTWDAQGVNSNNLPGINVRFFVDSKIAPGVVRRLAYPVPAIHSGSVTVGFEWEPSHPQLLEDKKFWWFLGEDVDGSIVRLIATKILFYTEFSLVYEGADSDAKRLPDDVMPPEEADDDEENARKKMYSAQFNEVAKVKLKPEQKSFLGLQHVADDVPDSDVLAALDRLVRQSAAQATTLAAAEAIIAAERAEVVRLATLAELGESADAKLNTALTNLIAQAASADLAGLKQLYAEKAQAKLGVKNGVARSSVESNPITQPAAQPAAGNDFAWL